MIKYADAAEVAVRARDWTQDQLECRFYRRHSWQPSTAKVYKRWNLILQKDQCRCGALRVTELNAMTGRQESDPKIDYSGAEGYLIKGLGRISGNALGQVRLEGLQRLGFNVTWVEADDPDNEAPSIARSHNLRAVA